MYTSEGYRGVREIWGSHQGCQVCKLGWVVAVHWVVLKLGLVISHSFKLSPVSFMYHPFIFLAFSHFLALKGERVGRFGRMALKHVKYHM